MLSIFQHALCALFTRSGIQALRWDPVIVAGGQVLSPQCDVDMRILTEDHSQLLNSAGHPLGASNSCGRWK